MQAPLELTVDGKGNASLHKIEVERQDENTQKGR